MKITQIKKTKHHCYEIFIEDSLFMILPSSLLQEAQLKPGQEYTDKLLLDLKKRGDLKRAKNRAERLLAFRDHSKKEMTQKLSYEFDESIAAAVLAYLETHGWIDDTKYAEKLANKFLLQKRYGPNRAYMEIYKKGISSDIANDAVHAIEIDIQENILYHLQRKYTEKLMQKNGYIRTLNALIRLGYPYHDAKYVLDDYIKEMEIEIHDN